MTSLELFERYEAINKQISDALDRAGRNDSAELIVVTKNHPASLITDLASLGVKNVGENRHQEASQKHNEVLRNVSDGAIDTESQISNLNWHFIGQLQSNKAKAICEWANVIHSIDSQKALNHILLHPNKPKFFLQYSADRDQKRSGLGKEDLFALTELIPETEVKRFLGVMMVAPLNVNPEATFEQLKNVSDELQERYPEGKYISAGMSEDFEIALQYGATHLRIGTAITGKRSSSG